MIWNVYSHDHTIFKATSCNLLDNSSTIENIILDHGLTSLMPKRKLPMATLLPSFVGDTCLLFIFILEKNKFYK